VAWPDISFAPIPPPALLAAGRPAVQTNAQTNGFWYYLGFGLLAVAIVIGVTAAYRIWHETQEEDEEPVTNDELLAEFQAAHAAGEMDDAEFQRVRALLSGAPGGSVPPLRAGPRPPGTHESAQQPSTAEAPPDASGDEAASAEGQNEPGA